MTSNPSPRRITAVAAVAAVAALSLGLTMAAPAGASVLGSELHWTVTGADRGSEGITVSGRVTNSGEQGTTLSVPSPGEGRCTLLATYDPTTARTGFLRSADGSCSVEFSVRWIEGGTSATFEALLGDPGGSAVDVLVEGAVLADDVSVSGTAPIGTDPDVVDPLVRTTDLVPRTYRAGTYTTASGLSLDTDVLFAVDSAVLDAAAGAALDVAVEQLQNQTGRQLALVGHTDSTGSDAHNLTLSQARADAVRSALVQRLGSDWTVTASGVGETQPLVPETRPGGVSAAEADAQVEAAKRLNRRVELVLS